MTRSKTLFATLAIAGTAVAIASFAAAPFNASARAAASHADTGIIAERIGGAFATVDMAEDDQAARATVVRAQKGDLGAAPGCESQTWPAIASNCLTTADGSAASEARFVTIGYQAGDSETVLLRVPAERTAAR